MTNPKSHPKENRKTRQPSLGGEAVSPAKAIRVLLLEDQAADADLMLYELRKAGFDPDWRRVETEEEFIAHLDPALDVILADYALPQFDGLRALHRLKERNLDIPFIIVSGMLGDELAARCIKEGVTDYLLKDRLERLGFAVANAMEEKRLRIERHAMDEQLRHAQKMEITGQLAGGIAHDFGNVLTVINGWSSLLLEDKSLSPETLSALRQIYIAGGRAASLTRQLLFFSSKRPIERRFIDLNGVIDELSKILRRLIGEDIRLETTLMPGPLPIEADPTMMEQVLFNLAVNARDAMPHGGRLVIATEVVDIGAADLKAHFGSKPGRFVRLNVRDNGCGIPVDILPRIFEPFFTTKAAGKGTGLGLATVFGIVKQHEGWLDAESKVGEGTSFSVYLPAAAPGSVPASARPETGGGSVIGGQETILAVEDETSVREFIVAALQPYGYRVLQARSGVEAMEVWKWHAARIDLLVTDVVMPDDMSGPELAARLLAEKPGMQVIFTSGYGSKTMAELFALGKRARLLPKPYSPRALATAVREALDERKNKMSGAAAPIA